MYQLGSHKKEEVPEEDQLLTYEKHYIMNERTFRRPSDTMELGTSGNEKDTTSHG